MNQYLPSSINLLDMLIYINFNLIYINFTNINKIIKYNIYIKYNFNIKYFL